jgi:hypothetical protein
MLMSGDAATGQSGSPLDALDLQRQILKADGVVAVDGALKLQRENALQIPASAGQESAAGLRGRHLKTAIELGHVVFSQKLVGGFESAQFA